MKNKFIVFLVAFIFSFSLLQPLFVSATITATLSSTIGAATIEYINPVDSAIDRSTDTYYALLADGTIKTYDEDGAELLSFSAVQVEGETLSGIAVHPTSKNIYLTSSTGVVKIYDDEGTYLSSYGGAVFTEVPTRVAVDVNGSYVTNGGDGALYFFDTNHALVDTELYASPHYVEVEDSVVYATEDGGSSVFSFTTTGTAIDQVDLPYTINGLAILDNGTFAIGIVTRDERAVYVYDTDAQVIEGSPQSLNAVATVEITSDGFLVAGYESNADGIVEVFDMTAEISMHLIPRIPPQRLQNPSGIAISGDGSIYVSDTGYDKVNIYNGSGSFVSTFGSYGTGNGQFNDPTDIALDTDGNVYVTDRNNQRIQVFSSSGTYLDQWAVTELGGSYVGPVSLAIRGTRVYVVGEGGDEQLVQVFSLDGTPLFTFGGSGTDPGQFTNVQKVDISSDGTVFVFEEGNGIRAVSRFTSEGVFISKTQEYIDGVDLTPFPLITGATFDSNDNFYFSDSSSRKITILNTDDTVVGTLELNGDSQNLFSAPTAVAVSTTKIFVADQSDGVVYVFTYSDDVQYESEVETPRRRSGSSVRFIVPPVPKSPLCEDGGIFVQNLRRGNRSLEVRRVQDFLRTTGVYNGPTTGYFGPLTEGGVMRFQLLYRDTILTPLKLSFPTGLWYPATRAQANTLLRCDSQ